MVLCAVLIAPAGDRLICRCHSMTSALDHRPIRPESGDMHLEIVRRRVGVTSDLLVSGGLHPAAGSHLLAIERYFPTPGLSMQGEMLSDALSYSNVALGGTVCICVLNLLGNAVRGTGHTSLHASVLVGCVLAYIVISPVLIFGVGPLPALGPAGAGRHVTPVLPSEGGIVEVLADFRATACRTTLHCTGNRARFLKERLAAAAV